MPLDVADNLRDFHIDDICESMGIEFASMDSVAEIDPTLAFPVGANLQHKIKNLEESITVEDDRIRAAESEIQRQKSMRRMVKPSDRARVDRLIRDQKGIIDRANAKRESKSAELASLERVLERVANYKVQPPR